MANFESLKSNLIESDLACRLGDYVSAAYDIFFLYTFFLVKKVLHTMFEFMLLYISVEFSVSLNLFIKAV